MTGTIINAAAILGGGILGVLIGSRLKEKTSETVMQAVSLVVIYIGIETASKGNHLVAILVGLVIGGIIGELLGLETHLENLGLAVEKKLNLGRGRFALGFVTTTILFCVGPMAILGSIQDGLGQGYEILLTKSTLDGLSAIAFSASLGFGVPFSAFSVLLYQGTLTLLAGFVGHLASPEILATISGAGGILIIGIGLNMLGITKIRVTNLLPGLVIAPIIVSLI